jgi:hypothetical protein
MRSSSVILLASIAALCGCAQTVKLTGNGVNPPSPALTLNASTLVFGDVFLDQSVTQTVTATSTGTGPVTISSIAVSGSEFSIVAPPLPVTLQPQASTQIQVSFNPTVVGAATGAITVVSNALASPVQSVACSASATNGKVVLTWNAPSGGSDPISGYNAYRAPSGSSVYLQINSTVIAGTTFTDTTVTSGQSYNYYVVSVGQDGVLSVPSNTATVAVP